MITLALTAYAFGLGLGIGFGVTYWLLSSPIDEFDGAVNEAERITRRRKVT